MIAYSKAKMESSGNKRSCFRPFWMGNISNRFY